MQKSEIKMVERGGIHYLMEEGKRVRYMPWIGDLFAQLYDPIMSRKVFPDKFKADIGRHFSILKEVLEPVREQQVLEIAAGSGSAVNFLDNSNVYTGLDISVRLLKEARKKLLQAGFQECRLYNAGAEELPFEDESFDVCLCILSLNFFNDIPRVFSEAARVLQPGGFILIAVPIPERIEPEVRIRGSLLTEKKIAELGRTFGLGYEGIDAENGGLLYCRLFRQ
ncbi:MAG: class I SAM-dependent methyltransferase [Sediminispirochaetaceae bacterium]